MRASTWLSSGSVCFGEENPEFLFPDVDYFFIYGWSVSLLVRNVLHEKFLFGPMG